MKLFTDYIGEVEYDESEIIKFPEGIFGFEEHNDFIIVGEFSEDFPFVWLQSIKDANVVFVLTNPFVFVEEYDFALNDESIKKLDIKTPEEIQVYGIVVIPKKTSEATINLKSPIVINVEKREAYQIILDGDWQYKHKLFSQEK